MSYGSSIKATDGTRELRQSWRTQPDFFSALHDIFHFTVDACASEENALLPVFWTKEQDCRLQDWHGQRVFCNPPFADIATIIPKVVEAELAVLLLPVTALTTIYFGKYPPTMLVIPHRRISFVPPDGLKVANRRSPCLGTVILVYGNVNQEQRDALRQFGTVMEEGICSQ